MISCDLSRTPVSSRALIHELPCPLAISRDLPRPQVLGSRLYTGPMYFKYNRVLREVGRARGDKRDEYISSDRMEELAGNMCAISRRAHAISHELPRELP